MKLFELEMTSYRKGDEMNPRSPDYEGPDEVDDIHTIQSKVQYEVEGRTCVLHSTVDIKKEPGGINRADIRKIDSIKVTGVEFDGGKVMSPDEVVAQFGQDALNPDDIRDAVAASLDM